MTTPVEAKELRDRIFELYVKKLSYREIATAVGISLSQVSEHMKTIRKENIAWFNRIKDPSQRQAQLLREIVTGMEQVLRELWYTYSQARGRPASENQPAVEPAPPQVRAGILHNLLDCYNVMAQRMGIDAQSMDEYGFSETLKTIQRELDTVKEEMTQKSKVQPLAQTPSTR